MPRRRPDRLGIRELAASMSPKIRRAFLDSVDRLRLSMSVSQIENLLGTGRFDEAVKAARNAAMGVSNVWGEIFIVAADRAATLVGVAFDRVNQRAVDAIRRNQLRFIREIGDETRNLIRRVMTEGIARGLNPRDVARDFRASIGLTTRQYEAVANYRRLLERSSLESLTRELRDRRFDSTVRTASETGEALSREQIDRMVGRYQDRYVKYRSEVIARTEGLRAANEGSAEMFRQAIVAGDLDPREMERRWNTAMDERVRSLHVVMHDQIRGLDEAFVDGAGNLLMYPGDPDAPPETVINCRCVVSTYFIPTPSPVSVTPALEPVGA